MKVKGRARERERFTLHNHRKTDDLIDLITGYRWSLGDDHNGGERIETTFSIRTRVSQETDITTFSLHSSVQKRPTLQVTITRHRNSSPSLMMGMKWQTLELDVNSRIPAFDRRWVFHNDTSGELASRSRERSETVWNSCHRGRTCLPRRLAMLCLWETPHEITLHPHLSILQL